MEGSVLPENDGNMFDLTTFKSQLHRCLQNLKSAGKFSKFEKLSNAFSPGLFVKGAGTIGIPLSDRDAKAIIEVTRRTHIGKLNVNGITAWDLPADGFETRNPDWQQVVDEVVQKAVRGLGVQTNGGVVTAELLRMQLYGTGTTLDGPLSHAQKARVSIGTLVICLPSKHEGGEIQLSYLGDTRTFDTALYSKFDSTFLAWYSNVSNERRRVISGYKLELVYNLCYEGEAISYPGTVTEGRAGVCRLITSWMNADSDTKLLVYRLRHPTAAKLCLDALGRSDRAFVTRFESASSDAGSFLYLAKLEMRAVGTCDKRNWQYYKHLHPHKTYNDFVDKLKEEQAMETGTEDSITLTSVVDLNGVAIAQNIQLEEQSIIQPELFERDPDEENYDSGSAIHYYRETVALLVSKKDQPLFCFQKVLDHTSVLEPKNERLKNLLQKISKNLDSGPLNNDMMAEFLSGCRHAVANMKQFLAKKESLHSESAPLSGEVLGLLCSMCVKLDQRAMFLDILSFDFLKLPKPSQSSPSFFPALGMGILFFGIETLDPNLSTSINRIVSFHDRHVILDLITTGFKSSMLRSGKFEASRMDPSNLANTKKGILAPEATKDQTFCTWIEWHYRWALTHCEMQKDVDFMDLVQMGTVINAQFLLNDVTSAVKKYTSRSGLVMVFLEEVLRAAQERTLLRDVAMNAFRDIFPDTLKHFSLRHAQDDGAQRQKTRYENHHKTDPEGSSYRATTEKRLLWNKKIASILCQCMNQGLNSEFDQMISKILIEAYVIPVEHYDRVLLTLLKVFLEVLHEKGADFTKPQVRLLFQQGLTIYIDRYVRLEPRKPTGWATFARECSCEYCIELNKFLLDPNAQQCRVAKSFDTRMHIESQLSSDEADYKLKTDMSSAAHTLVITKTRASSQYGRESAAWKSRCKTVSKNIMLLGEVSLRELLGDQFDVIVHLKWVKQGWREPRNIYIDDALWTGDPEVTVVD